MTTILDKIVAAKRQEIVTARSRRPARELRAALADAAPARDFREALLQTDGMGLIAEVKKASPSRGVIRAEFDPLAIARTYADNGAACLSVLTDERFFQGSLRYLTAIREAISIPVLRKDFLLDSYQVLEARVAGADAVLLIAECLDDCQLRKLLQESLELGMTPLVEFYEPENLERVLDAGALLVGVNNRDLRTFRVDLEHTVRMRQRIPAECAVVGESGIHSRADVLHLQEAGVQAILVGEHLMAAPDIGLAVRQLLGR